MASAVDSRRQRDDRLLALPTQQERDALFSKFDDNGNGKLSYGEIELSVRQLWPELGEKRVLMAAFHDSDLNADGTLQRKEFRLFLRKVRYPCIGCLVKLPVAQYQ